MTLPRITDIIDKACIEVKAAPGHDVSAAQGRAFLRQFFFEVIRMNPEEREKFLEYCAYHYEREKEKENGD